ncbi:cytochrome c [Rhodobacteraceae bacterium D3-12]|nr:cytochrome c [Rhodobacteraceae bacterium D3-12]
MKKTVAALSGLILAGTVASTAISDSHADPAIMKAVEARQAQMTLYAFNLGLLGGMAKGAIDYDAEAATGAASNLAALAMSDQSRMWPKGSDTDALGDATAALPSIWAEGSDVGAKAKAMADAAAAMKEAAGGGLQSLQGAMAAVGGGCGGCHKAYRQSKN